ncbi:GNAT family N-acetyltransferase [Ancylobacter sp. MQZ15Z-1]|uniref:GNAT family N-acetyltransferase n=1 Tax=Ancylobacter mangrovi TaxID=2972472 RepID=A0A9X2PKB3_9HYPH|nr:GNAT family N-acetyltransferase [Ancylobacter mangrovi]MCS0497640.1 GNAT family N-acetyltransferase [Ancylobacter mangrovi]
MAAGDGIVFAREAGVGVEEFRRVLLSSGLSRIRPVDDPARLAALIAGANMIVTARRRGELLGIARAITDSAWCCYVSDLAVEAGAQGLGVGKGLLDRLRAELGGGVCVILGAVPESVGFYEKAGMEPVSNVFWYPRSS